MGQSLIGTLAAGAALTLYGCGGGDSPAPGPAPPTPPPSPDAPTPAPSPDSPTPSPTTTPAPSPVPPVEGLICTDGDDSKCIEDLNSIYSGFNEADESSNLGVPMRGRPRFDDNGQWNFCTGECYKGQPDCYTPAGLINHKIMKTSDNKFAKIFVDRYPVLIILQPETTLQKLTKCAWQYDGSADKRQNGGCGNGGPGDCDAPTSGFQDKCPEDESAWADETCPSTINAACETNEVDYPGTCYWKGPAFSSPVYPGAQPTFDFTDADENNQLRDMMNQRLKTQVNGSTDDNIPLQEYWNEITLDGRIIDYFLKDDPTTVIAAFGYVKDTAGADTGAQQFQDHYKTTTGKTIPVVAFDTEWVIDTANGPFVAATQPPVTV